MNIPRFVYVIFPYEKSGKVRSVYVGSAANVKERLRGHVTSKAGNQKELHELMKANGYKVLIVDEIRTHAEKDKEYEWIQFFAHETGLNVYNKIIDIRKPPERRKDETMNIGANIRDYLEKKGIRQSFIVEKTGISHAALSLILQDRRKLDIVEYYKICKALGVPLETFYKE